MINKLVKAEKYGVDWLLRNSNPQSDVNGNSGYFLHIGMNRLAHLFPGVAVQRESLFKGYHKDAAELVKQGLEHISQFLPKDERSAYLRDTQDGVGESAAPWDKHDTVKVDGHFVTWRIMMDYHNTETYLVGRLENIESEASTDAIEFIDLKAGLVKTRTKVYKITMGVPHRA